MATPGNARILLGVARAPFLLLALICAAIGIASAATLPGAIHLGLALLAALAALLAHVAVNSLNEYVDFTSGLDTRTQRTPFSGGSGTLPGAPQASGLALGLGLATLAATVLIGLYLVYVTGPALALPGLVGVALVVGYTPWINRAPLLCLLAPGIGFGPVIVTGTGMVLHGGFAWPLFAAALPMLFLASNLLLLNQFPDVEADRSVGRRHLPIMRGTQASARVYAGFLGLAYASVVAGWLGGALPAGALLALLTLPLGLKVGWGALRHHNDREALIPVMGQNVLLTLVTGALLALGLALAR